MSMHKLRWIFPTFALTLAFLAVNSPVTGQAPQLPTGMVKSSPAKGLQAATPNVDYLPPASPAMTGTPTAPTATVGTNTTQVATTAFVLANGGSGGSTPTIGSGLLSRGGPTPQLLEASGGPGVAQWCEPIMVLPFTNGAPGTADATYQNLDLSTWVPPGAVSVIVRLQVFAGTSGTDAEVLLRPVGHTKDNPGSATTLHDDGSLVRYKGTPGSGYSHAENYEVPVGPDRKIQYRRIVTAGSNYYYLQVVGWRARFGVSVSPPQIVVPSVTGAYPAWPYAFRDSQGNVHVGYVDSPNYTTSPGDHATNKTAWYSRNGGTPSILFTLAQLGCSSVSDVFFFQVPGSTVLHVLIRQDDGTNFAQLHASSTDYGLTWSALAAIPEPIGLPATPSPMGSRAIVAFFDFLPSLDGKILASAYSNSTQPGTDYSVALLESTDGVNWTRRSWIHQYATDNLAINETGAARLPSGRIVVMARAPTNGQQGYTRYSDSDGAEGSWSTLAQQPTTARWTSTRGIAVGSSRVVIYGRHYNNAINPSFSLAYWIADQAGAVLGGPFHLSRISNPSNGGYATIVRGAEGYEMWWYSDLNNATAYGPALLRSSVQVLVP